MISLIELHTVLTNSVVSGDLLVTVENKPNYLSYTSLLVY